MSLDWSDLPTQVKDAPLLDVLRQSLQNLDDLDIQEEELTEEDGIWRVWSTELDLAEVAGLDLDPATGRWGGPESNSPVEVDAVTSIAFGRLLDEAGEPGEGWRVDVGVSGPRVRLPFLRGAKVNDEGLLRADPDQPDVRLLLPDLVVRLVKMPGQSVAIRLWPIAGHVHVARMEPPHALIGPGDTVGFAFRSAQIHWTKPDELPPGAEVIPGEWQGLHLPEVRLFVAPNGLESLAVSAGVDDLWIGFGEHSGVTGTFEAEVINQGTAPKIRASFLTQGGRSIPAVEGQSVAVPDPSLFLVDVTSGRPPVTTTVSVDGAAAEPTDRVVVDLPESGSATLTVTATDTERETTAVFEVTAAPDEIPPELSNPATIRALTPETGKIVIIGQTAHDVTLALRPRAKADWFLGGAPVEESPAECVTVELPADEDADTTLTVSALRSDGARDIVFDCYFNFGEPETEDDLEHWAGTPEHTGAEPGEPSSKTKAGRSWPTTDNFTTKVTKRFHELKEELEEEIEDVTFTVDAYASFETKDNDPDRQDNETHQQYNLALSERRQQVCMAILADVGYKVEPGDIHGHISARDGDWVDDGADVPAPDYGEWRLARARGMTVEQTEIRAELIRRAPAPAPTAEDFDPPPRTPNRPDCFRRLGVKVELIRNTFVLCEIWGEFHIGQAVEETLQNTEDDDLDTAELDTTGGICAFRVGLRLATDRGAWEVTGQFRAAEADLTGLWRAQAEGGDTSTTLNMLGALAVTAPLAASVQDLSPAAGTLVQLGALAFGASDLIQTQVLTLHGAELLVSDGMIAPDGSTDANRGTQISLMLDVEVAFHVDLTVFEVPEDRPIQVRYQAIGVRSSWGTRQNDGITQHLPVPVFDPSQGYELDIRPDALQAASGIGRILQVQGVRVFQDDGIALEVEAGLSVPLGPLTIDTVRVHAQLDESGSVQVSKLGASLDIPGTVHGSGSLELTEYGFAGTFDVTVVPLDLRGAATLAIETKDGVTGVLIGIEVEFPVPILLGASGLGIFGLLGGVAINYARDEDLAAAVPALDWLMAQLGSTDANVMHPDGWEHEPGSYTFAAGALLGTLEGGYVLHMKGVVLIEIPGPRLLLVKKADVLSAPPELDSEQSASLLAVLDIDFGRGTITLDMVASYGIEEILDIHVPVTAFFNTKDPGDWLVHLGSYDDRITVSVFDHIKGSGYLMVQGDGSDLDIPGLPSVGGGMALAVGFDLQAVLLGTRAARLYVEAAAGFHALIGFDPFFLAGTVAIRGELMLFVVSISVRAELTLMVGQWTDDQGEIQDAPYVHGQVCGSFSAFFFEVQGCVELTIGSEPEPEVQPRDLVAGLVLVGRTPALVEGMAAGRSLDGMLGEATELPDEDDVPDDLPTVPLDAIPVLQFHQAPDIEKDSTLGQTPHGTTSASGTSAWTRVGERWLAYKIIEVSFKEGELTDGSTPSSWWWQQSPDADSGEKPSLALLNWLPTPFPHAIPLSETLTDQVTNRWENVCQPPAPAQEVLWTFANQRLGSSSNGWTLQGTVWPDPRGTLRTAPAPRMLSVWEPWRTGDHAADVLQGSEPAVVVADAVACPMPRSVRTDAAAPLKAWLEGNGDQDPSTWAGPASLSFKEAAALLAEGTGLLDAAATWHDQAHVPQEAENDCEGRILRAPGHTSNDPAPHGPGMDQRRVKETRDRAGWQPAPLAEAVALSTGDQLARIQLLLLVPTDRQNPLRIHLRNAAGDAVAWRTVDNNDLVSEDNPLPRTWVGPTGPWAAPVELAGRAAAKLAHTRFAERHQLALITWDDIPDSATDVMIGWEQEGKGLLRQDFHVVAVSALQTAEVHRNGRDDQHTKDDQESLTSGIRQDVHEHALLKPAQHYQVKVTWAWDSEDGDQHPTREPEFDGEREQTQTFAFDTEKHDNAPVDLSPWLLASDPGMGETGVFCRQALQLTLATQHVTRLFNAYGRQLEVTVRSATGETPNRIGADPNEGIGPVVLPGQPVYMAYGSQEPDPVAALETPLLAQSNITVQPAWAEEISKLAPRLPCVAFDGADHSGSVVELFYDLEPLTDYLLDMHSVNNRGDRVRVHRVNFTTSRFDNLAHLASWLRTARVEHRLVRDVAPLNDLPTRPAGAQWDEAVQAAGLPVPQTPAAPRVQVWWHQEADTGLQPLAVVIECSEPLVRQRPMPTKVEGPQDAADPDHQWWAPRPWTWLDLQIREPSAGQADSEQAGVDSKYREPVIGPGGTRALIRLAQGSRGKRVTLDLVRLANPLTASQTGPLSRSEERRIAVDLTLSHAPWEVDE